MSLDLEHAIGCNVRFPNICLLHPDGKSYVKAVGGVVILGDLNNPHEQVFLHGHDDFITCIAISHRGDLCASGQQGANADVILWDLNEKAMRFKFEEHDHGIDCLCFSHDGAFLVTCGCVTDQRIFVFDTVNCTVMAFASINPKPTLAIIDGGFVRDIKRRDTPSYQFATCGGNTTLVVWHMDPVKMELLPQTVGSAIKEKREFTCLAFSADYEYLFGGTTTGDMAVVLMKNRVVQTYIHVCNGGVTSMVVLPSQQGVRLLVGGGDGTATMMVGPAPTELREFQQVSLDGKVLSMSLSPDISEALAVSVVGTCFRLRCQDLSIRVQSQSAAGAIYDVAYPSSISDLFLTASGDGYATLWDANDYSATLRCPVRPGAYPTAIVGSQDILVAGCSDGRLMSFDMAQGQNLWHIDNAHKQGVTTLQIAQNVRFLLSGGGEGDLRVWEFKNREMVSHLKEHKAKVNQVKLFPNGQYAISCSRDRCLLTWDLRGEKRLTAHREKHGGINCLALESNQTSVITAGQEKSMTFWDLRMADPVRVVELDEELQSISISPDDRYLATAGTGQIVRLWDVASAKIVSVGKGHSREIKKLSFSPDGKQVVSAGLDHSILVWNMYTD
mmetsp:Transcript_7868/g.18371  ORF Transcript_7868/g.18371 Transcript_7868/m.18371 type:complete len:615 (-) Transcript_7868:106-1950(-)